MIEPSVSVTLALTNLRPGATWRMVDEDYNQLDWTDESQSKPTLEEVQAELTRLTQLKDSTHYQRLRAAEYPDFKDYLDGIVKGDQAQVQAYIDACLAVKSKYPKP